MNKIRFILLIALFIITKNSLCASSVGLDYDFSFYYDSNILHLSEEEKNEFLAQTNPEKYDINSVDSYCLSNRVELTFKSYIQRHTHLDKFIFNSRNYLKNSVKDNIYLGFKAKQYLSSKFKFFGSYYYFADIYVDQYKSIVEPENIYRDFSYSKDVIGSGFEFDLIPQLEVGADFTYEMQFYDEYFKYYDCNKMRYRFWLEPSYGDYWTKFRYAFTVTDAYDRDQISSRYNIPVYKIPDSSHESDTYKFYLDFPLIVFDYGRRLEISYQFEYEHRFYHSDSDGENDPLHYGREDRRYNHRLRLDLSLYNFLIFDVFYEHTSRNSTAPAEDLVEKKKNYKKYLYGVELKLDLNCLDDLF
ncbi:MAG: hypothetical protein KGY74_09020 [Candidatus Cloacimonetes bacterium]|nr:hypothetical protein [Candidatus Cloacimonadota bacterium]